MPLIFYGLITVLSLGLIYFIVKAYIRRQAAKNNT